MTITLVLILTVLQPEVARTVHHRELLQITNGTTGICDHDTCVIDGSNAWASSSIQCDPDYPNCIVTNFEQLFESSIQCPRDDCVSCIIDCLVCYRVTIMGQDCQFVLVNISLAFMNNIVVAPGNGGTLTMVQHPNNPDGYTQTQSNEILSSPQSKDIIIIHDAFSYNEANVINATYITGDLNFSCIDHAECGPYEIDCGPLNTSCNINCSSASDDSCKEMEVYAPEGTSVVNWFCDSAHKRVCLDAILICGNRTHPRYSPWRYDDLNEWYYTAPDCIQNNWSIPLLTCTFSSDDTCYIDKAFLQGSRYIVCLEDLKNCQVQLGDDEATEHWPRSQSTVHCPASDCDSCIVQCISDCACNGITIHGYHCSLLEVHIRASCQDDVTIYAPGNGGELILLTNYDQSEISFSHAHIYSSYGTKNMILNFAECDGPFNDLHSFDTCNHNIIDGTHVTNTLNVSCNGVGKCDHSNITCPNGHGSECIIDCRSKNKDACESMSVYAIESTYDVQWFCDDTSDKSCDDSLLYCNANFSWFSHMRYANGTWKLENKTDGCVDIPTVAPSLFPTIPTVDPTPYTSIPSSTPTVAPTAAPTSAPIMSDMFLEESEFGVIVTVSLLVFILIVGALMYYFKVYKREKQSLFLTNPLVILIGIGKYEWTEDADVEGHLRNLIGIDKDIEHMVQLFYDELNYDVYPSECVTSVHNGESIKQTWTEQELKSFLEDRANHLEEHMDDRYDGLVVVVSCHGVPGSICTSDYKKITKSAMHRIFSAVHPKARRVPRLFLFDCCSGDNELEQRESLSDEERETVLDTGKGRTRMADDKEYGKQISVRDVSGSQLWVDGDNNPDYRLAMIEAANYGFQSKLLTNTGSYMIHSFYEKTMEVLAGNKRTFIYEIFERIQEELHQEGKQLPTYTWNTDTRYIRFQRADKDEQGGAEMTKLLNIKQ